MEIEHQIIVRGEEEQQTKQQVQLINPPSPSSSPSHEFSFTISLHPPPQPPSDINTNKLKSPPPPPFTAAAIDLSPADEIFFHGHLLPLHILSGGGGRHLPAAAAGVSPRTSTNSLDSFTLPIKEVPHKDDDDDDDDDDDRSICKSSHVLEGKDRGKSKSFSLIFGLPRKSRKGSDDDEGQKRKSSRFELVKRLVKPFLSLRKGNQEFPPPAAAAAAPPPPYNSYSGNLRVRNKREFMRGRRRGEFSAPASIRNSPTNSGRNLVAASGGSGTVTPTKSDSTMEELQAAIQAAIAHCKKSVHAPEEEEDRIKLQP